MKKAMTVLVTVSMAFVLSADEQAVVGFRMVPPSRSVQAPAQTVAEDIPEASTPPGRVRIGSRRAREPAENAPTNQEQELSEEEDRLIRQALQESVRMEGGNMIRPGMQITVSVLIQGKPEIKTEPQRINEHGRIGLPLIENVLVANKSMEEIETYLTDLYREYFREPHVIVEFVGSTADPYMNPWGFVTLIGRVGSQGPVPIPPTRNMTLSGALKSAGGLATSARADAIMVYRPNFEDDTVERIRVDFQGVGRQGNHEDDITLRAGDVIFVRERIW